MKHAPLLVLLCACAGAQTPVDPGPSRREVLREDEALLVIQEALVSEGTAAERSVAVRVGAESDILVDLRLVESLEPLAHGAGFAIEWVTDDDKKSHADVLPAGTPDGPLRIVTGKQGTRSTQVLVLDASAYGYEVNPQLVQRGAPGISEAEERVRRDVLEFLDYARSQE
jgi:hypothetical protein